MCLMLVQACLADADRANARFGRHVHGIQGQEGSRSTGDTEDDGDSVLDGIGFPHRHLGCPCLPMLGMSGCLWRHFCRERGRGGVEGSAIVAVQQQLRTQARASLDCTRLCLYCLCTYLVEAFRLSRCFETRSSGSSRPLRRCGIYSRMMDDKRVCLAREARASTTTTLRRHPCPCTFHLRVALGHPILPLSRRWRALRYSHLASNKCWLAHLSFVDRGIKHSESSSPPKPLQESSRTQWKSGASTILI
ncbi:hypothetical protein F5Y15DRAFT_11011 [Xylariaceae sp. FL0016]|nr:hypothetical protein F5Y15DRAFT_11011 [Xylariaceae sp. FL0016]